MKRVGAMIVVAAAAALTMACGGADSLGASPTGPTSTGGAGSSPSQPQPSCMPAVPANLAVASIHGTVVTLTWSAAAGATEYLILVGPASGSSADLSTNTTHTDYTWTVKDGKHYARVQAKGSCGYSSSSNEVEFTVG